MRFARKPRKKSTIFCILTFQKAQAAIILCKCLGGVSGGVSGRVSGGVSEYDSTLCNPSVQMTSERWGGMITAYWRYDYCLPTVRLLITKRGMPQEASFLGTSIKLVLGKHHAPMVGTSLNDVTFFVFSILY